MIIWLASYPKSGNTLLRSLLSAYFFSKDGKFDFSLLGNIKQFPENAVFKNLGIDVNNEHEIVEYLSDLGNNDVPYPYAIDDKGNYILMNDKIIINNIPDKYKNDP